MANNSVENRSTDFRALLKELLEAITITQFYGALGQAEVSLNAGFIDDGEFGAICEVAESLDPALYLRWERSEQ